MRIPISPVDVDGVVCSEAEVSVAASSSASIRLVPVDASGVEYPQAALGLVAIVGETESDALLAAIGDAVAVFVTARGV